MVPNILKLLTNAIESNYCIAIRYHDQRQIRVVEPHAIYNDDRGELVVDCYQTRGYSSSGRPPPFWRPFRLKKIMAISILKETFSVRSAEGYNPNKLKYRSGLVACVNAQEQKKVFPDLTAIQEMGPFLPDKLRTFK